MKDITIRLHEELRKVEETTTLYELAKKLEINIDELLTCINEEILPEFKTTFQKVAFKMPFWNNEKTSEFYKLPIVDMGFLIQHKIKDFAESLKKKHSILAHQVQYNNWVMYRGY